MQLFDRLTQGFNAAELAGNLDDVAVVVDGPQFHHVGDQEPGRAVLGVLVGQPVENLPDLGAVLL